MIILSSYFSDLIGIETGHHDVQNVASKSNRHEKPIEAVMKFDDFYMDLNQFVDLLEILVIDGRFKTLLQHSQILDQNRSDRQIHQIR
jgi:hypothetical protein